MLLSNFESESFLGDEENIKRYNFHFCQFFQNFSFFKISKYVLFIVVKKKNQGPKWL